MGTNTITAVTVSTVNGSGGLALDVLNVVGLNLAFATAGAIDGGAGGNNTLALELRERQGGGTGGLLDGQSSATLNGTNAYTGGAQLYGGPLVVDNDATLGARRYVQRQRHGDTEPQRGRYRPGPEHPARRRIEHRRQPDQGRPRRPPPHQQQLQRTAAGTQVEFQQHSGVTDTCAGVLSGGAELIKTEAGSLTLSGANTCDGSIDLQTGTLVGIERGNPCQHHIRADRSGANDRLGGHRSPASILLQRRPDGRPRPALALRPGSQPERTVRRAGVRLEHGHW